MYFRSYSILSFACALTLLVALPPGATAEVEEQQVLRGDAADSHQAYEPIRNPLKWGSQMRKELCACRHCPDHDLVESLKCDSSSFLCDCDLRDGLRKTGENHRNDASPSEWTDELERDLNGWVKTRRTGDVKDGKWVEEPYSRSKGPSRSKKPESDGNPQWPDELERDLNG